VHTAAGAQAIVSVGRRPYGPKMLTTRVSAPVRRRSHELLPPVEVHSAPASAADDQYVDAIEGRVESDIQRSMRRLAPRRRFPLLR
jgi:hypothetical protein